VFVGWMADQAMGHERANVMLVEEGQSYPGLYI